MEAINAYATVSPSQPPLRPPRFEDTGLTCDYLHALAASLFEIDPVLLTLSTRGRARVAMARQVAMYLAHVGYGLTLTEVGEMFGRDRTTVAHACRRIEDKREERAFDRAMDLLELSVRVVLLSSPAWQRYRAELDVRRERH